MLLKHVLFQELRKIVNDLIPGDKIQEPKSKEFLNTKIKEALALHFTSKSGNESAVLHKNDGIVDEFVNVLQRTTSKSKNSDVKS